METKAFLERANLLLNQGRSKEAEVWVMKALETEPDNDYALSVLARCYLNGKQYDKGIETIRQAISIDPEESHYFYLLAYGYYQKNERGTAIGHLTKAIELFPHHAEYYGLMAFIFLDEKEFELALQKADEGLALDPENITCLNARARAQNKLRQTNEAIATMQDALAIDPDNEFTHVTIGWNFLEKGKHKEATTHFREALRISPAHHSAKVGLKEALKSKIPPYRWLLQFNFWMQNKSKAFRWVFIISILVGVRLIEGFSKENPQFENAGIVVAACYFLFVGTSWIINPLANVFLLFHKDGKYALENSEKWNAIAFIICILSGIILIILSSVVPDKEQTGNFIASGFIVLSLCVPAGHMNYPVRIKGNSFSQWIAISLLLSAVIAVLCTLTGLIAPMVFFVIYFILFVVYTWSKAF